MKPLLGTLVVALLVVSGCATPDPTPGAAIAVPSSAPGSPRATSPNLPGQCGRPVGGAVPACSHIPTAPPTGLGQLVTIPTAASAPAGQQVLCPAGALTPFTLAGDPTKVPAVWGINSFGDPFAITWPARFTARFSPDLQIVDPSGAVVARGGVVIADAGGSNDGGGGDGAYICMLNGKTY